MNDLVCYHCGNTCDNELITVKGIFFCCNGCKTVFEIFAENDLKQNSIIIHSSYSL